MKVTAKVKFETTMGDMIMELYGEEMPITVENFLEHVKADYYTGLIFHRVIPEFVIQGGGFLPGMMEKQAMKDPIKLEISPNLKHEQYAVSMARTQDPNSATSQFFVCTDDAPSLDNNYAVFGKVVEGTETVDKIKEVPTKTVKWFDDVPKKSVMINKAYILD